MPYSWISWRHFVQGVSLLFDSTSLCQVDTQNQPVQAWTLFPSTQPHPHCQSLTPVPCGVEHWLVLNGDGSWGSENGRVIPFRQDYHSRIRLLKPVNWNPRGCFSPPKVIMEGEEEKAERRHKRNSKWTLLYLICACVWLSMCVHIQVCCIPMCKQVCVHRHMCAGVCAHMENRCFESYLWKSFLLPLSLTGQELNH